MTPVDTLSICVSQQSVRSPPVHGITFHPGNVKPEWVQELNTLDAHLAEIDETLGGLATDSCVNGIYYTPEGQSRLRRYKNN